MLRASRAPDAARRRIWRRRVLVTVLAAAGLLAGSSLLAGPPAAAAGRGVVIPIRGEITDVMRDSVRRRVEQARAEGADTIIFEMHTPGGMVTSALDICGLIKNLPRELRTVAWVHHKAYSAGAMIAVACRQIVMSAASSIGDCAPIMVVPGAGLKELPAAERAKAESPVLQEFRDSAIRNGYDPLLCRAMVTVGQEVWWVENPQSGARRFVDGAQKQELVGGAGTPASARAASAPAGWRLVRRYVDPISGAAVEARQPVDSAAELLTLSQSEAVVYGLASGIAADLGALRRHLGLAAAPGYHPISGWEKFAMWLNSPLVRGVLFIIMIVGAYIEFQSPGLILPGAVALVALAIFLGAPYVAGLADIWTIVLLVIGLILLALEILVIPGFGIAGILGIALVVVALIGTFVPQEPGQPPLPFHWPDLRGTWDALKTGVIVLGSSLIIAVIGIMLLARYVPELPGVRKLLLTQPKTSTLPLADPYPGIAQVGQIGLVVGPLKPAGTARFGTEVVDVQSQGQYVESGRRVQVLRREGRNIIVCPLADEA